MSVLTVGDPAPWFTLPSSSNPTYHFDTVGGYTSILFFFGSAQQAQIRPAVDQFCQLQSRFEQLNTPFFGVSIDPGDRALESRIENPTYLKFLWDFEQTVSILYGVCQTHPKGDKSQTHYTPTAFVLNPSLHVVSVFPFTQSDNSDHFVKQVLSCVESLQSAEQDTQSPELAVRQAPVLFIPQVFDRDLCQRLITLYETSGGRDSGFMRQIDGKTVEVFDYDFKKRRDFLISDPTLLEQINTLILRRVKPEIEKVFQFSITRFERHLVACYEASDRGFFNRHRDNTTKGTAHRRFAMSLNLNTGDYEGGYLRFPEYGSHLYRPETGEAIIFSCSLLHEATPITSGRRFALLSFFYNDEDARLRQQNQPYVVLNSEKGAGQESSSTPTQSSKRDRAKPDRAKPTQLGFQPKPKRRR